MVNPGPVLNLNEQFFRLNSGVNSWNHPRRTQDWRFPYATVAAQRARVWMGLSRCGGHRGGAPAPTAFTHKPRVGVDTKTTCEDSQNYGGVCYYEKGDSKQITYCPPRKPHLSDFLGRNHGANSPLVLLQQRHGAPWLGKSLEHSSMCIGSWGLLTSDELFDCIPKGARWHHAID